MNEPMNPVKYAELELDYAFSRLRVSEKELLEEEGWGKVLSRREKWFKIGIAKDCLILILGVSFSLQPWLDYAATNSSVSFSAGILFTGLLPILAGGIVHSWCDASRLNRAIRLLGPMEDKESRIEKAAQVESGG